MFHTNGCNILGSLHCDPVQSLPLSFELFLIRLCYLILPHSAISHCLCVIEQRIRLVYLLMGTSQSIRQSGSHVRRKVVLRRVGRTSREGWRCRPRQEAQMPIGNAIEGVYLRAGVEG